MQSLVCSGNHFGKYHFWKHYQRSDTCTVVGCHSCVINFISVFVLQIPPSRATYNNVINACGAAGNWKKALELCKKMTRNCVGPDLVTHNIVLSAFKNGSQYLKAIAYFKMMKGANIAPDTFTLNIVIHCLVKVGQYEDAVDLLNSMREKRARCPPDVVTYTTIMHSYYVCKWKIARQSLI